MSNACEIQLIDSMASDLMVVNAARVSFGARSTELTEADKGLIRFLMRERHGTPFEHNAFTFHVKVPIFVAREWFRHRIGSFNEMSGRYSHIPSEYWTPSISDVRTQVGKPGSYTFAPVDRHLAEWAQEVISTTNADAFKAYEDMVAAGVAKEVARSVLPVGTMTQFYWTVNARSLMNFLSLRTTEQAQKEIRTAALQIEQLFASEMPVTYEAWVDNGKVTP